MNNILTTIFLSLVILLTSQVHAEQNMKSTIMALHEIDDKVNQTTFNKSGAYEKLAQYQKINEQAKKLEAIARQYANTLHKRAVNNLPIKGEDLSIMRALMNSTILLLEKTSLFTNTFKTSSKVNEVATAQQRLASLIVKINYVKLYRSAVEIFFKNNEVKKVAVEIFNMINNPKQKAVMEKFSEIPQTDQFAQSLQFEANRFVDNHYYYLKLLNPTVTKAVVILEQHNIEQTILGRAIPKLKLQNVGTWFVEIWNRTTNFVSGLFGNFVGAIRFRHGYMKNHQVAVNELYKILRPLDIIAEKTPFAATDFFIPGHFGHIAIYLGTEEQLKQYGLWDAPLVRKYHHLIRQGKTIVESIRPGSRMVSLEDFLEIDEITIIRDRNILNDKWQARMTAEVALEQLWKEYDFNFDISTLDKVVCSEVPYHAFGYKRWPTSYVLGRHTISPDEIIQNAFTKGSGVDFILSLKAKRDRRLNLVSKVEMASNLDIDYNAQEDLFTKKEKKCRTVTTYRHANNRASRYHRRCTTYDKPLIYNDL
ncbi:YiiX/YebB-like N1pC/P60 family cysteine hydrolase [Halobacteriovorax sp. YZS-1-1]|uniref:YiiX/YebB-like N1pC/P60 family cysteine hydrolase n=1 Tax=unclassified Halobacteriovorax TaxID=2639665 RepID=UPI003999D485